MKILWFLLCKRKTQHRWHEKYFCQSFPKELLLPLLLLLPALWLTKECVRHVWFTSNESLNSCGCREVLKQCKYQVWFPSHIKENKLNSIWKISLLQCLKKEHHVTMIHCYMLILSECWRAHEQNPIICVPEHGKGEGQAVLLRPTHNAPGPTKGILVHALMPPPTVIWGPVCPPAISSYLPSLSSLSQKTTFFFFPTLCDTTRGFLVCFMFQETNDGENISEALSFVNDKCRDLYETPGKWKYWLWAFSSDEKCYLGEECHYCNESTAHTSQA